MGWSRSAAGSRPPLTFQAAASAARPLRDAPAGGKEAPLLDVQPPGPAVAPKTGAPSAAAQSPSGAIETLRGESGTGPDTRPKRDRRDLPVYDVASGEDLETPVHLDNSLLQSMFPDLQVLLGQVPPPPPFARPDEVEAHYQAALEDLARDLHGTALDVATGARKEGRFLFTDRGVGRMVADTFQKIMAYGGLLASPCLRPPKYVEGVRVLVVPEGEMGTGDCAGKVSQRLVALWGQDGTQAGQFRLGVQLDEETLLVGKGTLKRMDYRADGDEYDLILPDSAFKGNVPDYGEHTWDIHLGFNAWSRERRTRLSYQVLQWFDPDLVEQCIFPRAAARIPLYQEAMKCAAAARAFLQLEREERDPEVVENQRGEWEADTGREPTVLEEVLLADVEGTLFDHPYVQRGLRRRLRQAWHDLAVGGGVKVPAFMGLPDSFRGMLDWLPEGVICCPDLPVGEVLATRYPIRTRHDVQIWHNVTSWRELQKLGFEAAGEAEEGRILSFFLYARQHRGVAFMGHPTAKRVGGDFDGDVFQLMPVTPHKPLSEIKNPNRDWSDLAPLVEQVRREGWGQGEITPKVKRRLATHVAPERPEEVTETNRKWLASAAIQQGGQRAAFLRALGQHLDARALAAETAGELGQVLLDLAGDPQRSLDEAVEIAAAHGFDAHAWVTARVDEPFALARRYNRLQAGRQALKNMDSHLGQIVYTVSRVNASDRFTPEEKEETILRLAAELQAEVDKFKYDTAANLAYINQVREKVGRELVWLDVHKDPEVFVTETALSPCGDAVSHLWNHVSREFRTWERALQPPSHFEGLLPTEFSAEEYALARKQVRAYGRAVATALHNDDERAMVSAIQRLRAWSETYTDPDRRRRMAQAVWHAAHKSTRAGATASAAFQAFQPEVLAYVADPRPLPMREVLILGPQHANNLGPAGAADYDEPRQARIRVTLEDYTTRKGIRERRLAAYELGEGDGPQRRIGYLPKDAPRQEGDYLATLHRPLNRRGERGRIEGTLSPLQQYADDPAPGRTEEKGGSATKET